MFHAACASVAKYRDYAHTAAFIEVSAAADDEFLGRRALDHGFLRRALISSPLLAIRSLRWCSTPEAAKSAQRWFQRCLCTNINLWCELTPLDFPAMLAGLYLSARFDMLINILNCRIAFPFLRLFREESHFAATFALPLPRCIYFWLLCTSPRYADERIFWSYRRFSLQRPWLKRCEMQTLLPRCPFVRRRLLFFAHFLSDLLDLSLPRAAATWFTVSSAARYWKFCAGAIAPLILYGCEDSAEYHMG